MTNQHANASLNQQFTKKNNEMGTSVLSADNLLGNLNSVY